MTEKNDETTAKALETAVTPTDPPSKPEQVLIGIDLGTLHTAAISEGDVRSRITSVVGYPKDIIAKNLLKGSQLIGEDALKNKSSLELYMPLENGTINETNAKNLDAARILLKHILSLQKVSPGAKVCGVIGVPAQASMSNKEVLLKLANEIMDIAMVISEPFLVAYSLNKISNAIIIDIGAGTTDICIMNGALPSSKDQFTIFQAGNYIDKRLAAAVVNRYPAVQITHNLARKIKEQYAFVGEPEQQVSLVLRQEGKPCNLDVTEELKTVCESIVPEIVEKVSVLVPRFDPEDQEEALKNIYIAGGGSRIRGLNRMIQDQLHEFGDVVVTCVDDPEFAGSTGAFKLANDIPPSNWSEIGQTLLD